MHSKKEFGLHSLRFALGCVCLFFLRTQLKGLLMRAATMGARLATNFAKLLEVLRKDSRA